MSIFGLMVNDQTPLGTVLHVVGEQGLYRPLALFLDRAEDHARSLLSQVQTAHDLGLRIWLTVRANGNYQQPTQPPDLLEYRNHLRTALLPFVSLIEGVAIENEMNIPHYWTGTPEQYLAILTTGCQVCHDLGLLCTDGGLTSQGIGGWLVDDLYRTARTVAQQSEAVRAARVIYPGQTIMSYADLGHLLTSPEEHRRLAIIRTLFDGIVQSQVDRINFHWYIALAALLRLAVRRMRRYTQRDIMTNEIGLLTGQPVQTVANLSRSARSVELAAAIWFAFKPSPNSPVQPLFDENGRLNAYGRRYRRIARSGTD